MINKLVFVILLIVSTLSSYSQTNTILVDFGGTPSLSPWNNVSNPNNGSINSLINSFGWPANISLEVIDSFNSINTTGTQMPDPALGIPNTASGDSFYGNTALFAGDIQPTGGIRISNLDTGKLHTITIFSSRLATNNRETQYVLSGLMNDTAYLNVANNTDSVAILSSYPTSNGTIDITASPGPNNNSTYGFYYLGALMIEYPSDSIISPSLNLLRPNGGEFWQNGKNVKIAWESTTQSPSILEYSTDNGSNWNHIDTIPVFQHSFSWNVPNMPSGESLIRITSDTLIDQSDAFFEIADGTDSCPIVVIGSSTAAGTGASIADSSWVNRYSDEIYQNDTRYPVINLSKGGYTTYHLLPTGNPLAGNVGITIDTSRNITKALSLNPSAVIINLPSNDAANYFSVQEQLTNYNLMVDEADQQGVSTWVCTTQPRNFSDSSLIQLQTDTRDSIIAIYGNYSIDFWSGLADFNGFILPPLNSGDGVHLNDTGHRILFEKVLNKNIVDSLCNFTTVGLNEFIPSDPLNIVVYPNPFQSNFQLKVAYGSFGFIEIVVYDIYGRELYNIRKEFQGAGNQIIDINPNLPHQFNAQLLFLKVGVNHQGEFIEKVTPLLYVR